MKTVSFPYIALALGLFLLLVVARGSQITSDGSTSLPLLTLLVVGEFSFLSMLLAPILALTIA
ncbi:MAG: hypothetical protein Q9N32_04390 [Gammaproteobacteria bacterium]|nr:hypothetical protein [Gammaproteobacteria bacterium]